MANFKRHKPKTFDYPTCPGGMKCKYDVATKTPTNNSKVRHPYKDYRQPQFYNDGGQYGFSR